MARTCLIPAALIALATGSSALALDCAPAAPGVRTVEGLVMEAPDGATLCVRARLGSTAFVRVALADVSAPRLDGPGGEAAKWRLRRAARGRQVVCVLKADGAGGACKIGARSVADILAAEGRPSR